MYLKRIAEQSLKDILAGDKVGVTLGARQVGKTTLVERVLAAQPVVFLNFDVEVDMARFQAAALLPRDGLGSLGSPGVLVIDEAQSEVDLVVKQGSGLRAFEIKWSSRRIGGRAFRDAHGVEVEPIHPENPFAADILKT
jgi:hypothetical protein